MVHHANSSEEEAHMISTVFSPLGSKKAGTSNSLEKSAWRIGLRANDSNYTSFDLISYSYFLLTLEAGGVGDSVHSFALESSFTPVFLVWLLVAPCFPSQKCPHLELYSMVIACGKHGKWLGKGEAQVIGKFIVAFFRAEKKCLATFSFWGLS